MLSERINRRDPEIIDGIFQNVDAAAMADGEVVVLNVTATPTIPGKEIKKSTAASQLTVVGVVVGDIPIGSFGRVRVYGLHPNVKTTVAALAAGLTVNSDAAAAAVAAAVYGAGLGVSVVVGAANRAQIFIRAMGM